MNSASFYQIQSGNGAVNNRMQNCYGVTGIGNAAGVYLPTSENMNSATQISFFPQQFAQMCYAPPASYGSAGSNITSGLFPVDLISPNLPNTSGAGVLLSTSAGSAQSSSTFPGRSDAFAFYQLNQPCNGAYISQAVPKTLAAPSSHKNYPAGHSCQSGQNKKKPVNGMSKTNLYIAGLAEDVTDSMVYHLVDGVISPKSCKALLNDGKCTGTGFIDCKTEEDAMKAKRHIEDLFEAYYASKTVKAATDSDTSNNNVGAECDDVPVEVKGSSALANGSSCTSVKANSCDTSDMSNLNAIAREGRKLEVKFAYENEKDLYNVYVRNLPKEDFSEEHLRNIFQVYGVVISVKLLEGQNGTGPTGAGFVRFSNIEDTRRAIDSVNEMKPILPGCEQAIRCKLADKTDRRSGRATNAVTSPQNQSTIPLTASHSPSTSKSSTVHTHSNGTGGFDNNCVTQGKASAVLPQRSQVPNSNANSGLLLATASGCGLPVSLAGHNPVLNVTHNFPMPYAMPQPTTVLPSVIGSFNSSMNSTSGRALQNINASTFSGFGASPNPAGMTPLQLAVQSTPAQLLRPYVASGNPVSSAQSTLPMSMPGLSFCDNHIMAALQAQLQAMHVSANPHFSQQAPATVPFSGALFPAGLIPQQFLVHAGGGGGGGGTGNEESVMSVNFTNLMNTAPSPMARFVLPPQQSATNSASHHSPVSAAGGSNPAAR